VDPDLRIKRARYGQVTGIIGLKIPVPVKIVVERGSRRQLVDRLSCGRLGRFGGIRWVLARRAEPGERASREPQADGFPPGQRARARPSRIRPPLSAPHRHSQARPDYGELCGRSQGPRPAALLPCLLSSFIMAKFRAMP
jgi:hypothetical protein